MSDFLSSMEGQGLEAIGGEDVKRPFLKIAQTLSPECNENRPEYIEGLKPGQFFNSLTKFVYGKEIGVVVLDYESVWLEYRPNRGGFAGIHKPHSFPVTGDPFTTGLKAANGNEITDSMVYYMLIENHMEDGPVVFSVSSTGLSHAKMWNSLIINTRLESGKRAPLFAGVWKLSTMLNSNQSGDWYTIGQKSLTAIERVRFIEEDEWTQFIEPNRTMIMETKKSIDFSGVDAGGQRQLSAPSIDATKY